MDYAEYHIVYVDNRVSRDLDGKLVQKSESERADGAKDSGLHMWEDRHPECLKAIIGEIEEVRSNLKSLLSVFNGGTSFRSMIFAEDGLGTRHHDIPLPPQLHRLTHCSAYLWFRRYLHG